MSILEKRVSLFAGTAFALALIIGFTQTAPSYAEESPQETAAIESSAKSITAEGGFPTPDYQGKKNLKDYWDTVLGFRADIASINEVFGSLELTEERRVQVDALLDSAKNSTNLAELEATQTELNGLLDAWIQEALGPVTVQSTSAQGGSYYSYDPQTGVLTRSGGVNSYGGRTETWYSQRVLPGGGLQIPGRHVADDGTIRDADGYIVVAASDLAYGSTVDTSLGAGKVYDSGCSAGVTDIYTDW